MSRVADIDLDSLLVSIGTSPEPSDELTERVLDAAGELFVAHGIRRCSVDQIAERAGLGRTTVYRRFAGRNDIVRAVLVRECRRFFASIMIATSHIEPFEDRVVEGIVSGLEAAEASVLSELVRSEPEINRLLTIAAAPVIAAATDVLVGAFGPISDIQDEARVRSVAELLVRYAISVQLSGPAASHPGATTPTRAELHVMFDPLLAPLAEIRR